MNNIYTPRSLITQITKAHDKNELINPCVCTKINIDHWEISISMDSSITPGDLGRTDIRLFDKSTGADHTHIVKMCLGMKSNVIFSDSDDLLKIMKWCNGELNQEVNIVYAKRYEVENSYFGKTEEGKQIPWYSVDKTFSTGCGYKSGTFDVATCFITEEQAEAFYDKLKYCGLCATTYCSWIL
jgi:hypothetical protein